MNVYVFLAAVLAQTPPRYQHPIADSGFGGSGPGITGWVVVVGVLIIISLILSILCDLLPIWKLRRRRRLPENIDRIDPETVEAPIPRYPAPWNDPETSWHPRPRRGVEFDSAIDPRGVPRPRGRLSQYVPDRQLHEWLWGGTAGVIAVLAGVALLPNWNEILEGLTTGAILGVEDTDTRFVLALFLLFVGLLCATPVIDPLVERRLARRRGT